MPLLEWIAVHWVAAILLLIYVAVLMYNALLGQRASDSISGYYLGGRRLGGFTIGVSFFATFASTNSYIGHAGKGYEYGLPWLVMAFSLVLFTYISWRWIGPRTRRMAAIFDAATSCTLSKIHSDSLITVKLRAVNRLLPYSLER
mgnify:CR=1 FL=1